MTLKYFRIAAILVAFFNLTLIISCKKDDAEFKRQLAELTERVTNIENQLSQIGKDLVLLQEQGKLNVEEINSLKALTASLSTLTNDIKNNTTINSAQIESLKIELQKTVSVVVFDELRKTLSSLSELVNSNYLDQTKTEEKAVKLNEIIGQIAADLNQLKSQRPFATLDRPIEVKVSKGDFGKKVVVSWIPVPMATNYQIFKFDEKVGEYTMVGQGPDTAFVDLSINEAYKKVFYKVKVVNSINVFSKFSDINYGYASGKNFTRYLTFGYEGTGVGLFQYPRHVAVDKANFIYISDEGNDRVQKFDRNGNFIEIFYNGKGARGMAFLKNGNAVVTRSQYSPSYIQILDNQKRVLKEWGTYGNSDVQFGNIEEIVVDDQDNIYVVDGINNFIKKFDSNGNFLLKFVAATRVADQSGQVYPFGICILNDKVFVTSPYNNLIRVFDKQGNYIKSLDLGKTTAQGIKAFGNHLYINCNGYVMKTDEDGEIREKIGEGDFIGSNVGLAVNSEEEIIISDQSYRKIMVFKKL